MGIIFCEPHGLHLKLTMISFADFHSTAKETSCMRVIMLVYAFVMAFLSLNVSTSIRRNFARLSHFCNLILLQRGIPNNAVRLNPVKEPCVCSGLLAVDFWLWNPDSWLLAVDSCLWPPQRNSWLRSRSCGNPTRDSCLWAPGWRFLATDSWLRNHGCEFLAGAFWLVVPGKGFLETA